MEHVGFKHEYNTNYIVPGWFTPNYRHWAERLSCDLDGLQISYDLVPRPKLEGGWEVNTVAKPSQG